MKKMFKKHKYKLNTLLIVIILMAVFSLFNISTVKAKDGNGNYPKLANIYLSSPIKSTEVDEFAKWDVLILNMYAQFNSADKIRLIRQKNPQIIILAYITSEEFPISMYKQWEQPGGVTIFSKLLSGITPDMWLLDQNGEHVTFWKDNWMLNVSNYPTQGRRWNDYLSSFVVDNFLSSGLWDGIFYDNVWTGVSWLHQGKIDINNDKQNDSAGVIDTAWNEGMEDLFRLTREKANKKIYLVGNGDRGFYGDLNGLYMENFTSDYLSWPEKMRLYKLNAQNSQEKNIAILGNTTLGSGNAADYQRMRFGLTSALLENGYYAFDDGSNSHAEKWWYDEYNVNLGTPVGPAFSQAEQTTYRSDVWERNYTNGLAIVNSTNNSETVQLGDDYEKIHGIQDKTVNDGSIVSEVTVNSNDGLLLLKTFNTLQDILFKNGSFVRFFSPEGNRLRNGFFIFEADYAGGDKIAHFDFDGSGVRDLLLVSDNKLSVWRDDGQIFMREYPYGINYQGALRVAIGDLNKDGKSEIVVAPESGYAYPIKIYSYSGGVIKEDWYPFGTKYKGGYSVAIQHTSGASNQLVVGTGSGQKGEVYLYSDKFVLNKHWTVFEDSFKSGINVATGDLYGIGEDSIIAGAMSKRKPEIRVFDGSGKLLSKFIAYQALGLPGVEVAAGQAGLGNKDVIISMSNN